MRKLISAITIFLAIFLLNIKIAISWTNNINDAEYKHIVNTLKNMKDGINDKTIPDGHARINIYRAKFWRSFVGKAVISINGVRVVKLKQEEYYALDYPEGQITIGTKLLDARVGSWNVNINEGYEYTIIVKGGCAGFCFKVISAIESESYKKKKLAKQEAERIEQAKREEKAKKKAEEERIAEAKRKEEENRRKAEAPKKESVEVNKSNLILYSYGSGFTINSKGDVVTNFHVIKGCDDLSVVNQSADYPAQAIAYDQNNDLAILKSKMKPSIFFSMAKENAQLTDDLITAGYPLAEKSSTVKVTKGIVSSLAGLENDFSIMQIDAALQSGNSGGPVFNMSGNVIGVSKSKLNVLLNKSGVSGIPENVNFAIKVSTLKTFLEANNVNFKKEQSFNKSSKIQELATSATFFIACWVTPETKAILDKEIASGNVSKVLYNQ